MRTYTNAEFIAKELVARQGRYYQSKLRAYLSKNPKSDFPSFNDFVARVYPTSG